MNEVLFGTSRVFSPWPIINDKENEGPRSDDPWTVRNSILARDNLAGHRWMRSGCSDNSGICSQGVRWSLFLASCPLPGCSLWGGARETGLTFSWRILSSASLSEKCSTLVSCRSISVSHTRMLSLVPSNSSLWLVKCCERGRVTFVLMAEQEFRQTARLLSAQGKGSLGHPQRSIQHAGGPLWGQEPGVWSWQYHQ